MRKPSDITVLCISSFFKGNRFIETCRELGCTTYLLTVESKLDEPWARESLDEVWALDSFEDREKLLKSVAWLFRHHPIDRIAPLDDFDVERAAALREYLRVPGMGETTARYFRDKLAMRTRARDREIRIPRFVHVLNHDRINAFLDEVPPPWMFKPRSEASAVGIRKLTDREEAWRVINDLEDDQPDYLLEEMIPGPVFHVDSIVWERRVVFAEAHGYQTTPFDLMHGGGVFTSMTLDSDGDDARQLRAANERLAAELGFVRGVMHTEFIRSDVDGELYFVETAARVGGAHIPELVEATTGVSLWAEWAKIEIAQDELDYQPPVAGTRKHGALIISLARQEEPDTSGFDDPEIAWRLEKKNHIGFVLVSDDQTRLRTLVEDYRGRFTDEFQMTLPAPDSAVD